MQNSTPISGTFEFVVAPEDAGTRLDVFLVNQFRVMSRSHVRRLINANAVSVDGQHTKAAYLLRAGQTVTITLPQSPQEGPVPEDVPIDVLFEDDHLVAIDKPSGMVVHPSKGHWEGTLTSALAFHFKNLSSIGGPTRPGIVHRLDRETSGVMVVAKTDTAHVELARQFENRTVEKEYFAIVRGVPDRDRDIIRQPIGPHPYQREKMAIRVGHNLSREAETFYEVDQRFMGFASVRVFPKTGRTHQIRLHLAHIGCPVLCDRLYGGQSRVIRRELLGSRGNDDDQVVLGRLALHARRIQLRHPQTKKCLDFTATLPVDISDLLPLFRNGK